MKRIQHKIFVSAGLALLAACSSSNEFQQGTYVGGNGTSKASLTFMEAGECYASWGIVRLEMSCSYTLGQTQQNVLLVTIEGKQEKFTIGNNSLTDTSGEVLLRK